MSSDQDNNILFFLCVCEKQKRSQKSRKRKLTKEEVTELKKKKSLIVDIISELHDDVDKFA